MTDQHWKLMANSGQLKPGDRIKALSPDDVIYHSGVFVIDPEKGPSLDQWDHKDEMFRDRNIISLNSLRGWKITKVTT